VDLVLHKPSAGQQHIKSVSKSGIEIGEAVFSCPLLLTAHELITAADTASLSEILSTHLDIITQWSPDVLLLGTGACSEFPTAAILWPLVKQDIGVEVMSTRAACHTFNLLLSDDRGVAAILMPIEV